MSPWLSVALMLALALLIGQSRTLFILSQPFRWAETFYHESSHALACLLTGGRVARLTLHWRGGGSLTSRGGSRLLILLAGYPGAALWGAAIYLGGHALQTQGLQLWLMLELAFLGLAALLWARNLTTWLIMGLIGGTYALALNFPHHTALPWLVQFVGLYVLLNAIRAPLHLIDGQHVGDGAQLADLFLIVPEIIWVALWFAFGLALLAVCLWLTLPGLPPLPQLL